MHDFHRQHKPHYIAFLILVAIAVVSGFLLIKFNVSLSENDQSRLEAPATTTSSTSTSDTPTSSTHKNKEEVFFVYTNVNKEQGKFKENIEKSIDKSIQTSTITSSATTEHNAVSQNTTKPVRVNSSTTSAEDNATHNQNTGQSVIVKINDTASLVEVTDGMTVYDAMKALETASDYSFSFVDFGGDLGMFIKAINDQVGGENNHYWIYAVNGTKANKGISHYTLQKGDIITWTYEESTY